MVKTLQEVISDLNDVINELPLDVIQDYVKGTSPGPDMNYGRAHATLLARICEQYSFNSVLYNGAEYWLRMECIHWDLFPRIHNLCWRNVVLTELSFQLWDKSGATAQSWEY